MYYAIPIYHPPCAREILVYSRYTILSTLNEVTDKFSASSTETEQFVQAITAELPANADRLEAHAKAQANDKICSQLIEFCTTE